MGAGAHWPHSSFRAKALLPPAAGGVGCQRPAAGSLSSAKERHVIPQSDARSDVWSFEIQRPASLLASSQEIFGGSPKLPVGLLFDFFLGPVLLPSLPFRGRSWEHCPVTLQGANLQCQSLLLGEAEQRTQVGSAITLACDCIRKAGVVILSRMKVPFYDLAVVWPAPTHPA